MSPEVSASGKHILAVTLSHRLSFQIWGLSLFPILQGYIPMTEIMLQKTLSTEHRTNCYFTQYNLFNFNPKLKNQWQTKIGEPSMSNMVNEYHLYYVLMYGWQAIFKTRNDSAMSVSPKLTPSWWCMMTKAGNLELSEQCEGNLFVGESLFQVTQLDSASPRQLSLLMSAVL